MRIHDLAGKDVAIWGAGREAASTLRALRRFGIDANVSVLDENGDAGDNVEGIAVAPFSAGALHRAAIVVRSPGISRYRPELRGCTVTTATNLWFAEPHAPVIAYTGTKGKSTSSSLTAHLLNAIGQSAVLAGNIGRSPLDLLGAPEPQWWVLELSSFQTSDLEGSPLVAAMTSFSPEHLDWHGNSETYLRDKTHLLELAANCVINPIDDVTRSLCDRFPGARCASTDMTVPSSQLIGRHNEQLIRLVYAVLQAAGIDTEANATTLAGALSTFAPLPHRLQPVASANGTLFVNDSLSTTPIAAIAAIDAFGDRSVTLVAGGYDRGVPLDDFAEYLRSRPHLRVVATGTSGERLAAAIGDPLLVTRCEPFDEAVRLAASITPEGGVVLLSPAAPSFDQFKDYAIRGDRFAALAQEIAHSAESAE